MKKHDLLQRKLNRRDLLRKSMAGLGIGASLGAIGSSYMVPSLFGRVAEAAAARVTANGKVLVVLELSGGNDGLNTVVP